MIALQSFYFFETAMEEIAAKIACGARYADGTIPVLLHRTRTLDDALTAMRTLNRSRAKGLLKWNRAREINENTRFVIDRTEAFCSACRNHSSKLNEIRIVRNHIAHSTATTRHEFSGVLRRRLGAIPRRLPRPGAFLLREPIPGASILTEYVVSLGVIIKDAARC